VANIDYLIQADDTAQALSAFLSRAFEIGLLAGRDASQDPRKQAR
jgi:hypothetical protein